MLPCDLDAHMEVIKQVTKADLGGYALPIYEGAGSVWGGEQFLSGCLLVLALQTFA